MKYLYLGCGILASLLLFSILLSIAVCSRAQQVNDHLAEAVQYIQQNDREKAHRSAQEAAAAWTRSFHFLSALIKHDELDQVAEGFSRLQAYTLDSDQAEFYSQCLALSFRLDHIAKMDVPFYYNFLTLRLDPPLADAV